MSSVRAIKLAVPAFCLFVSLGLPAFANSRDADRVLTPAGAATPGTLLLSSGWLVLERGNCPDDADPAGGFQVAVELWMHDLTQNVTGFQAFLGYEEGKLSYRGDLSTYTSSPFPTHIQSIVDAEVAAGQINLDGSDFSGVGTMADALLATLVFDVVVECEATAVMFRDASPFGSELSYQGDLLPTNLSSTPSFTLDDTPPTVTAGSIGGTYDYAVWAEAAAIAATTANDGCTLSGDLRFAADSSGDCPATVTVIVTDACGNSDAVDYETCIDVEGDEDGDGVPNGGDDCPETGMGAWVYADGCSCSQRPNRLNVEMPGGVFCYLEGESVCVELTMRCLEQTATGFQAFLAYDTGVFQYDGSLSSYSESPFPQHVRSIDSAEIAPGELNLDGFDSANIGSDEDSVLATLCFDIQPGLGSVQTVVGFRDASPLISKLSAAGVAVDTFLTDSSEIQMNDAEDPTITCPFDVSVSAAVGECLAIGVDLGVPTADDNCGTESVTNDGPAEYPVGATTVTWTATDAAGNSASCPQAVTVSDEEDPTIVCPSDLSVSTDGGECHATGVEPGTPTTDDNCEVADVANDAPTEYPLGDNTVTWTVTDAAGNAAECLQVITVTDDEDPAITCPTDIAVGVDPGACTASGVALGFPATADNCGVAGVTNDVAEPYPIGDTVVTWTVTDEEGNTATCQQTVTVTDNEDPAIACPTDIAVSADADLCAATGVVLGAPGTGDNCGVESVAHNGVEPYAVGTTVVTWTVTDVNGNAAECVQEVTVTDDESPTIICPDDLEVNAQAGVCAASASWAVPTGDDNCEVAEVTSTRDPGDTFLAGSTLVSYTVEDGAGNTAVCSFTVMVDSVTAVTAAVELTDVDAADWAGYSSEPLTRCMAFVAKNATSCTAPVFAAVELDGNPAGGVALFEIECGGWTELCAKDEQHTLSAAAGLNIVGVGFETASAVPLVGGDTDNDDDVDIDDVAQLTATFGSASTDAGCPWDGTTRDADFNNDGVVWTEDYTFIAANWEANGACNCSAAEVDVVGGEGKGPRENRTSVAISAFTHEVGRRADYDVNGVFDYKDVELFEKRYDLPTILSSKMRVALEDSLGEQRLERPKGSRPEPPGRLED